MAVATRRTQADLLDPMPILENGAEIDADEFLARYENMPGIRAELLNGVVYLDAAYDVKRKRLVPSPVNPKLHGGPHWNMSLWLGNYQLRTQGTGGANDSTIRMTVGENVPQPDLFLRILPEFGGQTTDLPNGNITGAPELIVEIAYTSRARDLGPKMEAYRLNRVLEYIVWRTRDQAVDWFVLRGSRYQRLASKDGVFRSEVFPGLWLDAAALMADDNRKVQRVLKQGLRSAEHAAFVKRLKAAR